VRRFDAVESPTFSMYLSQSRAPKTRPRQTPEPVKDAICQLRETLSESYHRPAGARLIRHYLLRDPSLQESALFIPTSSRTITNILRDRGYIQTQARRERIPLELPEVVNPNDWLKAQHGRVFRRRIRSNGTIQVDKHIYYVDHRLDKRSVLVHLDAHQRCLRVTLDGKLLPKALSLKGLRTEPLELQDYLKVLQEEAISIAHYRHMVWMQSGEVA
jgi:hypothetical protein